MNEHKNEEKNFAKKLVSHFQLLAVFLQEPKPWMDCIIFLDI